jgi:hypothetical protein
MDGANVSLRNPEAMELAERMKQALNKIKIKNPASRRDFCNLVLIKGSPWEEMVCVIIF